MTPDESAWWEALVEVLGSGPDTTAVWGKHPMSAAPPYGPEVALEMLAKAEAAGYGVEP